MHFQCRSDDCHLTPVRTIAEVKMQRFNSSSKVYVYLKQNSDMIANYSIIQPPVLKCTGKSQKCGSLIPGNHEGRLAKVQPALSLSYFSSLQALLWYSLSYQLSRYTVTTFTSHKYCTVSSTTHYGRNNIICHQSF